MISLTHDTEALSVHISLPQHPLTVICAYRPPTQTVNFWQKLTEMTDDTLQSSPPKSTLIVVGDFNVNVQDRQHPHYHHLETYCHDLGLRNIVNAPTRFPSQSTLDLVLVPNTLQYISPNSQAHTDLYLHTCSVEPCDVSDHQLVTVQLCTSSLPIVRSQHHFYTRKPPIRTLPICEFQTSVAQQLDNLQTHNDDLQSLQDKITSSLDQYCPLVQVRATRKQMPQPWVDDELRQLLFRRKRAHRAMIKHPDCERLVQNFRGLRRQCKLLTKKKRSAFFQQQLHDHRRNPRAQWFILNTLLGRKKISQNPAASLHDITTTFAKVITDPSLNSQIPLTVPHGPLPLHSFSEFTAVTADDILALLRRLDNRKATGPDLIPPTIYKTLGEQISEPLARLFSSSLSTGEFPECYKFAHVRPIYKRGDKSIATNYRPISLLPQMAKLMETLAHEQLMDHIYTAPTETPLLPPEQFAYRKHHSCEDLLACVVNDWHTSLDQGHFVVAAFLDMSKAFDSVNHSMLLQELTDIGVGGTALQWFLTYLQNREQRVVTKTAQGDTYAGNRGVPQGSVLGPSLFNISVRNLPSATKHCKARQYADDVSLYKAGTDLNQLTLDLAEDITIVRDFLAARGLCLNPDKTQFIIFRSKSTLLTPDVSLQLNNTSIAPLPEVKYLGIVLDEHLTFGAHIAHLERKIGNKIAVFRKIRHQLTEHAKKTFYISSIQSVLEYGSNAFAHCLREGQYERLVRLSRRALRTVFNLTHFNSISALQKRNHLLPLAARYQLRLFVLIFRSLNDLASPLLSSCFSLRSASSHTNSRTRSQVSKALTLPAALNRYGLFSLSFLGSDRWNSLPADIRLCTSVSRFRYLVLAHLGYPVRRP